MNYRIIWLYILIGCVSLSSCKSTKELYNKGNYDNLLKKIVAKKRANKRLSTQELQLAETGFSHLQQQALTAITNTTENSSAEQWRRLYATLSTYEQVQHELKQIEPLQSKSGYTAKFNFIAVTQQENYARQKYIEKTIKKAKKLLKSDDEFLARDAYHLLNKAKRAQSSKELEQLLILAKHKATKTVYAILITPTYSYNTVDYRSKSYLEQFAKDWRPPKWFKKIEDWQNADYLVEYRLKNCSISREYSNTEKTNYQKEIKEMVRNTNGSIVRDSTGNIIYNEYTANAVVEVEKRWKNAEIAIEVVVRNTQTETLLYSEFFVTKKDFELSRCEIYGDEKALPNNFNCTENKRQELPSDNAIVKKLINNIDDDIYREVNKVLANKTYREQKSYPYR